MLGVKKIILAIALCGGLIASVHQADANPADQRSIVALEQQWIDAFKENNPKLLEPILASSWVQTSSDGTLSGKSHEMADTRETKWVLLHNRKLKITTYGAETAIVTGIFEGKGTASWGAVHDHYRFTDTWVKMPKGNWQCVATQLTTLEK